MATNFRGKICEIGDIPSFGVLAFRNGIQYRNSDFKRIKWHEFLCFVHTSGKIQPSNSRDYDVRFDNFCDDNVKISILCQISKNKLERSLPILQSL